MSSRHWFGERSGRQFRIVVKTIAGKSYEITEMEGYYRVEILKTILMHRIIPTPSKRRMRLIFENYMLDDSRRLRECNICEGSELNLVLLPPRSPRVRDYIIVHDNRSPSRSRSRSRSRCRSLSPMLREGSPTRVYSLEVCREV